MKRIIIPCAMLINYSATNTVYIEYGGAKVEVVDEPALAQTNQQQDASVKKVSSEAMRIMINNGITQLEQDKLMLDQRMYSLKKDLREISLGGLVYANQTDHPETLKGTINSQIQGIMQERDALDQKIASLRNDLAQIN